MTKETGLIPTTEEMNIFQVMAKSAKQSSFFENKGGEAGILAIFLMARELGVAPMEALMGGINIILGKAEISPRLMNKLVRRAGHKVEIIESTDTVCKIKGTRHDTQEELTATFSFEDAKRANLVKSGGGYEKHPSDMLFARCFSRLARRLFPDVISSSYVEGEISDSEHVDRSDRVSRLQNDTDSSNQTVKNCEAAKVVEGATISIPETVEISLMYFLLKLEEKFGSELKLGHMEAYLLKLEAEKGVKVHKIMEQALSPTLTSRFLKGYKSWMDLQIETDTITDEAMRK